MCADHRPTTASSLIPQSQPERSHTLGRCLSSTSQYCSTTRLIRTTSGLPPATVALHQFWAIFTSARRLIGYLQLIAHGDEGDEERHGERGAHLHRKLALAFVGEGEVLKKPEAVSKGRKVSGRQERTDVVRDVLLSRVEGPHLRG